MKTYPPHQNKPMPLDHYISQVHLKNFNSPALGNLLYAIRKSDLNTFTPRAQDVCRIEEGSTNSFLSKERAVEDFLKDVEPIYNKSIEKFRQKSPDGESIYTIAGIMSYILTCSPTAMRLGETPLKTSVEQTALNLDAKNAFPPPPPEIGSSMTELIEKGTLNIDIDQKFPQALGIIGIQSYINIFGNSYWEILHNPFDNNPFFTSDFPIVYEFSKHSPVVNKIMPLAPDLAVRIIPDKKFDWESAGNSFSNFKYQKRILKRRDVVNLNRQIIRCAEDLIFYRDNLTWIYRFVEKNRKFYIEPQTDKIPSQNGNYIYFSYKIVER
jgi:hypothetical protein